MLNDPSSEITPNSNRDSRIVCDMLSMTFDGFFANSVLCGRVGNTLDKHVFKKIASLYRRLAERLLQTVGKLPEDTGTTTLEPGYIATGYLSALNAEDKQAINRVMSINWQVIKRIGKLVRELDDKIFANMIVDYLACIQVVLDNTHKRRMAAKLNK